ncbi:chemotaxis response regulator protein-glutamate methylesterase [Edaphobacter paludis]|uniref:Protein-glutamate methylesterase/protein-glutamine glutaminase n=1 Tax=Edaphobacter paludis TaxID=3035702 RepID=A0AAU7D3U6_9BACT
MGISSEQPLRVLAADDSAVMREIMRKLFEMHGEDGPSSLPRMELCGTAQDGVECLEAVGRLGPDVLVLDLEMPRLNGLDVLDRLRDVNPGLPVIMCSSYTERGARSTLEALARGAADYVMKPNAQRDLTAALQSLAQQLLPKIAALTKGRRRTVGENAAQAAQSAATTGRKDSPIEVVVIGLSTGGPSALEQMLPRLPSSFPVPVLIVQHMPKLFTGALAERLDKCCALRVRQAYDGDAIVPGTVWLAPGDSHMEVAVRRMGFGIDDVSLQGRGARVKLHQREPLNHCRPSVDYLFHSAARLYGAGALALMMTGMGADGLGGARAVHEAGGVVLAQDEATSAVWGMPGRVADAGIANAVLPLGAIAGELKQRVNAGRPTRLAPAEHAVSPAGSRREAMHDLL